MKHKNIRLKGEPRLKYRLPKVLTDMFSPDFNPPLIVVLFVFLFIIVFPALRYIHMSSLKETVVISNLTVMRIVAIEMQKVTQIHFMMVAAILGGFIMIMSNKYDKKVQGKIKGG